MPAATKAAMMQADAPATVLALLADHFAERREAA
jgi:hypothetical protein